eukprot:snap_masked-scaffold_13-processed-gene-3.37-mRNA-1 protein AED:1.00 eAED:1.00 QI:0/0/0/0/1/1/2/0/73
MKQNQYINKFPQVNCLDVIQHKLYLGLTIQHIEIIFSHRKGSHNLTGNGIVNSSVGLNTHELIFQLFHIKEST